MGCKNQGFPLLTYIFQCVEDFRRHFGIKGGGGFIEKKDFRVMSEGPGEGDSLTLAARKFRRSFLAMGEKLKTLEKLLGPFAGLLRGMTMGPA
jgi:hypothetical protein